MTRAIDMLMQEWVWYGGLLYTRYEVYQDVLKATGRDGIAKAYAFGWTKKATPEETTPEMLAWNAQARKMIGE